MNSSPDLRIEWCGYIASRFAVEHWHYSKKMPIGKLLKIGVWENGRFIGTILYGRGAAPNLHVQFDIDRMEICELVRVAMTSHESFVSQAIAQSLRLVKAQSPGLRLIVSYADPHYEHVGYIYQASNWIYVGESTPGYYFELPSGKIIHNRQLMGPGYGHYGKTTNATKDAYRKERHRLIESGEVREIRTPPKHKYLYPLDRAMRRKIQSLAKPYPKRAEEVSTVIRPASSGKGRVQSPRSAPDPISGA